MVIEIEKEVFENRDFKGLNFFLQLCTYKDRYRVYTEIDNELLNSKFFKRLDYDDQSSLIEYYDNLVRNQDSNSDIFLKSKYKVTSTFVEHQNVFTIDEAIRYFIQPLSIILENSKNDAYFINTIFKHFANDSKILTYLENNWIQFENAGGCDNIKNFIEGKKQSFNALPKSDKSKYLRCFVLMDSDKLHPIQPLKGNKKIILRFLIDNSISRHILRKRSIENYVPVEAIETLKTNSNYTCWIDAYRSLSEPQKDFFSIENGLSDLDEKQQFKKTKEQINLETNNLYDNIFVEPLLDVTLMTGIKQKGFGKFKNNFPILFKNNAVTKLNLEERAGNDELERIVHKIEHLL
ncbi:MAG: hypothetical protein QM535_01165 [Limnohabitans sp.]|nr:hypothetical protein [Limnohabitans sp.]